jgi:hypothetical protein
MINELRGKTKYFIYYDIEEGNNGELLSYKTYELYVVNSFEFGSPQSIIVHESATGDGGVSYSNGRMNETIPINGLLLGKDREDVNTKASELLQIQNTGGVVEFVSPYNNVLRSNRYYIQECKFTVNEGISNGLNFTMQLVEKREANIQDIAVNLVSFNTQQDLLNLYNAQVGNL